MIRKIEFGVSFHIYHVIYHVFFKKQLISLLDSHSVPKHHLVDVDLDGPES